MLPNINQIYIFFLPPLTDSTKKYNFTNIILPQHLSLINLKIQKTFNPIPLPKLLKSQRTPYHQVENLNSCHNTHSVHSVIFHLSDLLLWAVSQPRCEQSKLGMFTLYNTQLNSPLHSSYLTLGSHSPLLLYCYSKMV